MTVTFKHQAAQRPTAMGSLLQSSAYGATIPVIYGTTQSNLLAIWAANLRQGGGGTKKFKQSKKGITNYEECIDFLLGHSPIRGVLQVMNNGSNTPLAFTSTTFSASGGRESFTIPDSNFYFVIAVTFEASYSFDVDDYGGQGPQTLSGSWEIPLWNELEVGPDPTNPMSYRCWPFCYRWQSGMGATFYVDAESFPAGTIKVYYAQLTAATSNQPPITRLNMVFEPQLGSGNEYEIAGNDPSGHPYTEQQIIYPHFAGLQSGYLNLGAAGAIPQLQPEVAGKWGVYPAGDADFVDMIEDIYKSGLAQAAIAAETSVQPQPAGTQMERGLSSYDLPGTIQKKIDASATASLPPMMYDMPNTAGNVLVVTATGAGALGISSTNSEEWNPVYGSAAGYQIWWSYAVGGPNTVTVTGASTPWQMSILEIGGIGPSGDGDTMASVVPCSIVTAGAGAPWLDPSRATADGVGVLEPAVITGFSISADVVTFSTAPQALNAFQNLTISGLNVGTYLNGQVLNVLPTGLSDVSFQAVFMHADVLSTFDLGVAAPTAGFAYQQQIIDSAPPGQKTLFVPGLLGSLDTTFGTCFGSDFSPWQFSTQFPVGQGANGCPIGTAPSVSQANLSDWSWVEEVIGAGTINGIYPVLVGSPDPSGLGSALISVNAAGYSEPYTFALDGSLEYAPNLGTDLLALNTVVFAVTVSNTLEAPPESAELFGASASLWGAVIDYTPAGPSPSLQTLSANSDGCTGLNIPLNATITGLQVSFQAGVVGTYGPEGSAQLELQPTGLVNGVPNTDIGPGKGIASIAQWPTSSVVEPTTYVLGGPHDLWEIVGPSPDPPLQQVPFLTAAMLNGSPGLGMVFQALLTGNVQININKLVFTVYFTTPFGGPTVDEVVTSNGAPVVVHSTVEQGLPAFLLATSIYAGGGAEPVADVPLWRPVTPKNFAGNSPTTYQMQERIIHSPGEYSAAGAGGAPASIALIAFKATEPVGYPRPLGDFIDIPSFDLVRAQCRANGLWGSLVMNSQSAASDWIDTLCAAADAAPVFLGAKFFLYPYSEVSAAGNGAFFNPPCAAGPVAELDAANGDFTLAGCPPLNTAVRIDLPNVLQMQCIDRNANYAQVTVQTPDPATIGLYGVRKGDPQTNNAIQDPSVARTLLGIQVRRNQYGGDEWSFTTTARWSLLSPMDLVTLTDELQGITGVPVRIKTYNEQDDGTFEATAEPFVYGMCAPSLLTATTPSPTPVSPQQSAGDANPPIIFEPTPPLYPSMSGNQIWVVVSSNNPNFGGAQIFVSTDRGESYQPAPGGADGNSNIVMGSAVTGKLGADWPAAADPDSTNVLSVGLDESNGTLESQSTVTENNFEIPCYVQGAAVSFEVNGTAVASGDPAQANVNGSLVGLVGTLEVAGTAIAASGGGGFGYELMSFSGVAMLSAYDFLMGPYTGFPDQYTRRSIQLAPNSGGPGIDHPYQSRFAVVGPSQQGILKMAMPPTYIGQAIYFKICTFNTFGTALQSQGDVTPYIYVPTGVPGAA
jgi:hypothetical protein